MLGYYDRVMRKVPQKRCACTGWHGKVHRQTKGYTLVDNLYAGCRGPGAVEYELQINVPGTQYPPPIVTQVRGRSYKVKRHGAELVLTTYMGRGDPRPMRRHLGYYKNVAAAKRAARAAVERRCRKD